MRLGKSEAIIITRGASRPYWREGHRTIRTFEVLEAGSLVTLVLRVLAGPIDPPMRTETDCLIVVCSQDIPEGTKLRIVQNTTRDVDNIFDIVEEAE